MGNYRSIMTAPDGSTEPGINGGMMPRKGAAPIGGEAVNAYVCTLGVEDLDAMMTKVKSNGGTLALDKMPIPGVGQLAYMKDPEGNLFGMLQPEKM